MLQSIQRRVELGKVIAAATSVDERQRIDRRWTKSITEKKSNFARIGNKITKKAPHWHPNCRVWKLQSVSDYGKNGAHDFLGRNSLTQEQFAKSMSAEDKDLINREINDTLSWIDSHQDADVSEFNAKQKDLESKLMPIMQRAHQGAGGGMPGGIDPNMFNQGGASGGAGGSSGPRVEEVD